MQAAPSVPVQISLDGVLFGDLSFYGPDKLSSRRNMTLSEYEARRDRRYFKSLLAEGGPERLRQEMLTSLAHQEDRPSMDVQVVKGGARDQLRAGKTGAICILAVARCAY